MQRYMSRLECLNDSCTFRQIYEEVHGADLPTPDEISLDVRVMLCVPAVQRRYDLSQNAATYFSLLPSALQKLTYTAVMENDEVSFRKLIVANGLIDFTYLSFLVDIAVKQGLFYLERLFYSKASRYHLLRSGNIPLFYNNYMWMRSDFGRSLTELEFILLLEWARIRHPPISGCFFALRSAQELKLTDDWALDERPRVLMNSCPFIATKLLKRTSY